MKIEVNYEKATLTVPSTNFSMRVLLGVAAGGNTGREFKKTWTIVFKDSKIGTVQVKNFITGAQHAANNLESDH